MLCPGSSRQALAPLKTQNRAMKRNPETDPKSHRKGLSTCPVPTFDFPSPHRHFLAPSLLYLFLLFFFFFSRLSKDHTPTLYVLLIYLVYSLHVALKCNIHTDRDFICFVPHCTLRTEAFVENRNRLTDFESKPMVTKQEGWGWGREGREVWEWQRHILGLSVCFCLLSF